LIPWTGYLEVGTGFFVASIFATTAQYDCCVLLGAILPFILIEASTN
jgi:hypothetical protein